MFSVGETLKRARVAQNLDLTALAAQTKINIKYLEAIESDDRSMLPSSFFYRSFVDQYARSLSLDTREIDAEVDRVLSADAPLPLPGYESVVARNVSPLKVTRRFPARRTYALAATLILVVAGCSGVYGLWRNWRISQTRTAKAQDVPPHQLGHGTEQPARSAMTRGVPVAVASVNHTQSPALAGYKVMLDLLAREPTWLSVSTDGKPVFSGILQVNQTKTVGGKQFAKMRVGNAAGIQIRLNGKLLAPLGARGQVLDVLFTPDKFEIVAPPRESD
ncbi:MAG TPA: RodZ domain-containing protein [Bryobacteraceae bacterium]|nr:RodZ domain-containing protein [Bryobacteraceae bacterium]